MIKMIPIGFKNAKQIENERRKYTKGATSLQDAPLTICETFVVIDNKMIDTRNVSEDQLFELIKTVLEYADEDPTNVEDLKELIAEIRRQNGGELNFSISLVNRLIHAELGGIYNNLLLETIDEIDDSQSLNYARIIAQFETDCICNHRKTYSEELLANVLERMAANAKKHAENDTERVNSINQFLSAVYAQQPNKKASSPTKDDEAKKMVDNNNISTT